MSRPRGPERHGTRTQYIYGCKCPECKAANAKYLELWREKEPHKRSKTSCGTHSKYVQGCRCDECKKANAQYSINSRKRRIKEGRTIAELFVEELEKCLNGT